MGGLKPPLFFVEKRERDKDSGFKERQKPASLAVSDP